MTFLYGISNILYFIVFYLWGYRKKLAYENLKRAFPEKSEAEIQDILKRNYQYLTDVLVEYLKSISMSKQEIAKRFVVKTPEIFEELVKIPKGAVALGTHYGNFEWLLILVSSHVSKPSYGVYSGLTNPIFEKIVVKTRERWGGELMPMKAAILNSMQKLQEEPCVIGFICDQSPYSSRESYFTTLFGIPTAAHYRFADLVLKAEAPTYYLQVERPKRGYYSLSLIPMTFEDYLPYSEEKGKRFTDWYNRLLENNIRIDPAYWLWTHRRWKHEPPKKAV